MEQRNVGPWNIAPVDPSTSSTPCDTAHEAVPLLPLVVQPHLVHAKSSPQSKILNEQVDDELDTTAQLAPPGARARVNLLFWKDEGCVAISVETEGIQVTRRDDNHMINGSKLLQLAGMDKYQQDNILKIEKMRHVVEIGPMHLRGVWITFERALEFANREKLTWLLYPLFENDLNTALPGYKESLARPLQAFQERDQEERSSTLNLDSEQSLAPPKPQRKTKGHVASACMPCKRAHLRCDAQRPCMRCVEMKKEDTCVDVQHKRRGRPRLRDDRLRDDFWDRPRPNAYDPPGQGSPMVAQAPDEATFNSFYNTKGMTTIPPGAMRGLSAPPGARRPLSLSASRLWRLPPHQSTPNATASMPLALQTIDKYANSDGTDTGLRWKEDWNDRPRTDQPSRPWRSGNMDGQISPSLRSPQSDSATNSSDSVGSHDPFIQSSRKEVLIEDAMDWFHRSLSICRSGVLPASGIVSRGSSSGHDMSGSDMTAPNDSTSSSRNRGGTLQHTKRPQDFGDDDKNQDGRQPRGKRPRRVDETPAIIRRLACPYFKKDPIKFQTRQSCPGPGWETVHRVKEHLDRNHRLPISCLRCYTAFESERDRDAHMRSPEQCMLQPQPPHIDGFNASQRNEFKCRPKGYNLMTEAQKWRHVYLILFPDTEDQDVPSPYYEFKTPGEQKHAESLMADYERFLQRELPPRVRGQLERRIEDELIPVEARLRGQIVEIVRDTQLELFRLFKSSSQNRGTQEVASHHHASSSTDLSQPPRQECVSGQEYSAEDVLASDGRSVENHIELLRPDPLLDWESFPGFDGQLYDFGEILNGAEMFADSEYGVMPETDESAPNASGSG